MTIPLPVKTEDQNLRALSRHTRETRTGSVAPEWDVTDVIIEGQEMVFKNGLLLEPSTDYTVSKRRLTLAVAPIAADRLTIVYWYRVS